MDLKKMRTIKILLISFMMVFLIFSMSQSIWASEKIVKIVTLTDYPPYCFDKESATKIIEETIAPNSDSKRLQGYSWDIVRESFHQMGYTINLQVMPWARAMQLVEKGKADVIFPAGMSEERKKAFDYSQEFINNAHFLIYVLANDNLKWQGIESLNELKIATMRGWNFGQQWEANNKIIKVPVDNITQAFKMLEMKRVAGVVGYDIVFDYTLKKEGLSNKFKKMPPFDSSKEYLTGNKTSQKVDIILKDFDKGKQKLISNGKLDKISKKWQ